MPIFRQVRNTCRHVDSWTSQPPPWVRANRICLVGLRVFAWITAAVTNVSACCNESTKEKNKNKFVSGLYHLFTRDSATNAMIALRKILITIFSVSKRNCPQPLPPILNRLRLETNYELMIWSLKYPSLFTVCHDVILSTSEIKKGLGENWSGHRSVKRSWTGSGRGACGTCEISRRRHRWRRRSPSVHDVKWCHRITGKTGTRMTKKKMRRTYTRFFFQSSCTFHSNWTQERRSAIDRKRRGGVGQSGNGQSFFLCVDRLRRAGKSVYIYCLPRKRTTSVVGLSNPARSTWKQRLKTINSDCWPWIPTDKINLERMETGRCSIQQQIQKKKKKKETLTQTQHCKRSQLTSGALPFAIWTGGAVPWRWSASPAAQEQ